MNVTGYGRLLVEGSHFDAAADIALQAAIRYHNIEAPTTRLSATGRMLAALTATFRDVTPRRRPEGDFEFRLSYVGPFNDLADKVVEMAAEHCSAVDVIFEGEGLSVAHTWRQGFFRAFVPVPAALRDMLGAGIETGKIAAVAA